MNGLKATKQVVKAAGGVLFGWNIGNLDAAVTYLQFFDAVTASVTVGTTVPTWSFWIPASGGLSDWTEVGPHELGFYTFQNGLVIAATTTYGGLTSPANGLVVNLGYL